MPPARRKSARQSAPQTIEQATAALSSYVDCITRIETIRADADASIAAIEAARDGFAAPYEQEAKRLFHELRAWWAVAGGELTGGRRKSVELAGAVIGERTTTPRLKCPGGEGAIVTILLDQGYEGLLRTRITLDKPAILRALGDDESPARDDLVAFGLKAEQRDEFFIDRGRKSVVDPEIEPVAEPAIVTSGVTAGKAAS